MIVKPGLGHSWPGIAKDSGLIADWFDTYLLHGAVQIITPKK
jgi:hypothetical protein